MIRNISLLLLFFIALACDRKNPQEDLHLNTDPVLEKFAIRIAQNPDDLDAYLARAEYYYNQESYDQAIADLQRSLEIDSTHINALHLLADVYLDYFKSKKAIETLEYATRIHPEHIHTLLKKSEFHLILTQYEASMRSIDRVLQLDPTNPDAYFMFGLNFVEQGDTARAINSFQTAVENEPELLDGWIQLGQLHAGLGNSIAEKYFDSAISIDPENVIAWHAKADYLSDEGRLEEAIEVYRQISRIKPSYEEGYFNAGLIYLDMDSIPQAYEQFDICIKRDPLHIRAYYYRGLSAEFMGRLQRARADYEQALGLAPDYEDAQQGLYRVQKERPESSTTLQ
jgi:tetratricopeptide (TPR) repeat protein